MKVASGNKTVIHHDNPVPRHDACCFRGATRYDSGNNDGISQEIEGDTNTGEMTLHILVHPFHIGCRDIFRMGIQLLDNVGQSILHQLSHVDSIHIRFTNIAHDRIDLTRPIDPAGTTKLTVLAANENTQCNTDPNPQGQPCSHLLLCIHL